MRGLGEGSGNRNDVSGGAFTVSAGARTVSFGARTVSFTGTVSFAGMVGRFGCCAPALIAAKATASENEKTQRCTTTAGSQPDEPPVYFTP